MLTGLADKPRIVFGFYTLDVHGGLGCVVMISNKAHIAHIYPFKNHHPSHPNPNLSQTPPTHPRTHYTQARKNVRNRHGSHHHPRRGQGGQSE